MKTRFNSSSDVIHLFAQRTQDNARCSNVFFEYTDKIYSYGRHYLLAEFIHNNKNELAIMINDKGYSVTTAKHIREVSWATRQYKQFFTITTDPILVLNGLEQLINKLAKAKKSEMYISEAMCIYDKFSAFISWKEDKLENYPEINAAYEVLKLKT